MNNIVTIPMITVLVGVVLAGAGGFWANLNANKEKLNNIKNQNKFESKLNSKNEKIIQLNEKIILLNEEIVKYTLGGDNHPIITESIDHEKSICHFMISNFCGEKPFPLYDVYALIIDLDKKKEIEKNKKLTLIQKMNLSEKEAVLRVNVGYLSGVSGLQHLFSVKLPPQHKEKKFSITMTARNTVVKQKMTIYYDSEYKRYHVKSKAEKNSGVLFDSYKSS